MTFLEMARLARLRAGGAELAGGGRVIEAQLEAGYSSASAFRAAFAGWMGLPPGAFVRDARLRADWIETPMGAMVAVSSEHALHLLEFTERRALPAELAALRRDAKGGLGFWPLCADGHDRAGDGGFYGGPLCGIQHAAVALGNTFYTGCLAGLAQDTGGPNAQLQPACP